ncbi:hypothetical protein HDV01_002917 [Terramyces sp. JEL0728]|nr:hypothetical protein HDV01_002917 [Terramyces sp. JEL0728]
MTLLSNSKQGSNQEDVVDIDLFKKQLDLELLNLASELSPGVKLKSIMQNSDILNAVSSNNLSQDKYPKKNTPKEKQKVLPPTFHQNKNNTIQESAKQKWEIIDRMLEEKRAAYKKEWEEMVMLHSQQSKMKLDLLAKQSHKSAALVSKPKKVQPILEVKSKLPKSWKESKWYRKIANLKPIHNVDRDDILDNQNEYSESIKFGEPIHELKPKRMFNKYSPFKKGEVKEPPVLRELSIDKPLENDASNLWYRESHKISDSLLNKSKNMIQMSNAILKNKNVSSSFSTKQQSTGERQRDSIISFGDIYRQSESQMSSDKLEKFNEEKDMQTKDNRLSINSHLQNLSLSILKESRKTFLLEKMGSFIPGNSISMRTSIVPTQNILVEENSIESVKNTLEPIRYSLDKVENVADHSQSSQPNVEPEFLPLEVSTATTPLPSDTESTNEDSSNTEFTEISEKESYDHTSNTVPLTLEDLLKQDVKIAVPKPRKSLFWNTTLECGAS